MKIFKIDYYFKVHFFWTALLLLVNYQMNRSIAKYNLYDFEFSRAGIAGIHRKENPVYNFAAIFGMYTFFEIYPILFKNELTDF